MKVARVLRVSGLLLVVYLLLWGATWLVGTRQLDAARRGGHAGVSGPLNFTRDHAWSPCPLVLAITKRTVSVTPDFVRGSTSTTFTHRRWFLWVGVPVEL